VQSFINQTLDKVNEQASKSQVQISTTSTDMCRL
jgi:hypothetical protein